jgi:putative nucleotidyltransferase with HDIG domain
MMGTHSEHVNLAVRKFTRRLNFCKKDIEKITWAALLHDIGKIGIPDSILKKPSSLSDSEWTIMHEHSIIGSHIVGQVRELQPIAPFILHHHEHYDGSGYPSGLEKESIPIGSRIIALFDTYSAITEGRIYKPARSHEEAINEIQRCSGTQFDPELVDLFTNTLDESDLSA